MYKFGFNFFKIISQFSPSMGKSEIIPGQTGLNKKGRDITNFIS